jgi:hypothetical protein
MVRPSEGLVAGFVAMAGVLTAGYVAAVIWTERRRGAGSQRGLAAALAGIGWLVMTGLAASAGVLRFSERPPGLMLLLPVMLGGVVLLSRSSVGARLAAGLPLALLVGWQGFRLPLELMMHRAYAEGLMPVQMSYEGLNLDILTGISALVMAGVIAAGRASPRAVWSWNALGMVLLVNVVVIAILSTPIPLRVFHNPPANTWIAEFPFVWLPTVMVATALLGHLLIFRRLRMDRERAAVR